MFNFKNDLISAEGVITRQKEQFDFDTALDIGCGTGRFPIALVRSGVKAIGMDLSSSMIEAAKKNSSFFIGTSFTAMTVANRLQGEY